MDTLVIHAPASRVKQGAASFETILGRGIGDGYAIYPNLIKALRIPGSKVVLLRKDKNKKRAEGILVKLVKTSVAGNGIQRYDVYFKNPAGVPYRPENLNHCGVAVI